MIKSAFIYRITGSLPGADDIEAAMQAHAFCPCTGSQEKSVGWVPPRAEHGLLLEAVGGQCIAKLMTETKAVPAATVKVKAAEAAKRVLEERGRKPGKKETRELQEDARQALLPHAFPRQAATLVWIDRYEHLVVVDASTQGKADAVITALVQAIDGFAVQPIHTKTSPAAAMAHWLGKKEAPQGFSVDRECELKACDESKAVVRYGRHALDTDEVAAHIAMGKLPTRLALTFDDRVSFMLTDGLQLKKITLLDGVFEGAKDEAADRFDADVAIITGELCRLMPTLFSVLGGEVLSHGS